MIPRGFEKRLREILGNRYITAMDERICHSFDATNVRYLPDAVAYPKSAPEISEIMKAANEFLVPVVPRGAGRIRVFRFNREVTQQVFDVEMLPGSGMCPKLTFKRNFEFAVTVTVSVERSLNQSGSERPLPCGKAVCLPGPGICDELEALLQVRENLEKTYP